MTDFFLISLIESTCSNKRIEKRREISLPVGSEEEGQKTKTGEWRAVTSIQKRQFRSSSRFQCFSRKNHGSKVRCLWLQ